MIFPSLYEGFGIPLVEAMKAQCPIVCSDRGSIPEIAGHAAIHFNPEDPEDIALKVLKILGPEIRKNDYSRNRALKDFFVGKLCKRDTECFSACCEKE